MLHKQILFCDSPLILKIILILGADINLYNFRNEAPLHFAATSLFGNCNVTDCLNILLDAKNVNLNIRNKEMETPVCISIRILTNELVNHCCQIWKVRYM